jgi:hypothetical protein
MKQSFLQAWRFAFQSWRMVLFVYLLLLLMVLPLGMQLYHVLDASIGQTLSLEKLLHDYHHTVWMDMLNVHGASISPLIGQLRWVMPFYLFVAILLHTGLMHLVVREQPGWSVFWSGISMFYFSFLKMALFFLLAFFVVFLIIWLPFSIYIFNINEWLVDETGLVWLFFATVGITIFTALLFFNWSVLARFSKMKEPALGTWQSIVAGRKRLFRNFFSYLFLYFIVAVPFLIFWLFYLLFNNQSGMISPLLVWVFIVLQQLFIFLRIVFRVALFHAIGFFRV